jgi:hypothetical protein
VEIYKSFDHNLYPLNEENELPIALRLYQWQAKNNPVYKDFITRAGRGDPQSIQEIPFMPISFFKNHVVKTGEWTPESTFTSSGTTTATLSVHFVKDLDFYRRNSELIFEQFFGKLANYHILALLPSYLERDGSSLVTMADHFIRQSNSSFSGFYLSNNVDLVHQLNRLKDSDKKVLLLGVTFALLDLAEKFPMDLSHCLIMETGGMKGRRKEIVREELHRILCDRLNVPFILSEYGMTELLSQAYSFGNGKFKAPSSLKILIRDVNDPLDYEPIGRTGAINIIDFANIHSCAFIETEDLGKINEDGSFEVLGRMDNSDIRGCNLLIG